ncbi:MAG: serine/threonine protein kinase [Anaerolineae bacterium]|nr:serine/threonine protein kinase [Anaerolineae bacterium]
MADLTGRSIGKYKLEEQIGRGGMANVYKAYQPNLDRHVAIKIMHTYLSDKSGFITRFRREAKSIAALRHPNIVQVFDFDIEDEYYYMVMEYIKGGRTLKGLLKRLKDRRKRLPLPNTLDIITKLADALDYAHNQGMIHRDIKPANVLLRSLEEPILTDFGIARLRDEPTITQSGAMVGTPTYMSPEQGRGEPATAQSDIYALGAMMYEMVTGRPPYEADTPYGVIMKHINDPLVWPSIYAKDIPEKIEKIILTALAKDLKERYMTAVIMRDAITEAQETLDEDITSDDETDIVPLPIEIIDEPVEIEIEPAADKEDETIEEIGLPVPEIEEIPFDRSRRNCWFWAIVLVVLMVVIGGTVGITLASMFGQ